jgi:4-diphosphocytidyl-2-C-methyl-D-erythritol kinase
VGALQACGLHELNSFMLPLAEPHDEIAVRTARGRPEGSVTTRFIAASGQPIADINTENNTLTRACACFAERTGFAPSLDITVRKGVPHGAGLGGGSADAAALLRLLRRKAARAGCADAVRDEAAFVRIAAQTGSDVPFFLRNAPARVSGVGDIVEAAPNPFPSLFLLLLCPDLRVSTAWAFSELDRRRGIGGLPGFETSPFRETPLDARQKAGHTFPVPPPFREGQITRRTEAEATSSGGQSRMRIETYINDFEDIVFARYPELGEFRAALESFGAVQARMSGTGAALFGLFRTKKSAVAAARALAGRGCSVYMQQLPDLG